MIFHYILPILLILCANEFYNLGDWWHITGTFNIADFGNALIWLSLVFIFLKKNRGVILNPISPLILFYILFVFIQIFLANVNYNQSFFDGLVGTRHQFYYLSFFIFLIFLEDTRKITRLYDILIIISIGSVILALVNYFTPITIFSHKWAGGHGIRSNIIRAYVPGMPVVSFAAIWALSKWLNYSNVKFSRSSFIFLLFGHFFRQTRMRLVGVLLILTGQLVLQRKLKSLFFILFLFLLGFGLFQYKSENKIMTQPIISAFRDVTQATGTMIPRIKKIKTALSEFKRHPWIGSGVSAMRAPTTKFSTRLQLKMKDLSNRADLGYTHWIKFYGIVGIVWLILFFVIQLFYGLKAIDKSENQDRPLAIFSMSYLIFVIFSFFSLNHLMVPSGILLLCLNASIILRLNFKYTTQKNTVN